MAKIHPEDFGKEFLDIEKPARYVGCEFGQRSDPDASFVFGLGFPDLYEIGMSNQAIRILYHGLNDIPGARCERFFAPAPDFESFLKEKSLPLYGLELGTPLGEMDMIGFSIGYELCGTGILSVLDLSGIPRYAASRKDGDPIVIAGGPAISNPHPFAPFLDAVWIGEAEGGFFDLIAGLASAKRAGAGRAASLEAIARSPNMWMPGKKARRAVFSGFGSRSGSASSPIPSIKAIQDHGVVEIMRGCPNGCRFCHAGFAYRPFRLKSPDAILDEVLERINGGGYREISLSSLSSADYPCVDRLISELSAAFSPKRISFQLPSLRVNSFTLPLLKSLSDVRKSGLTFAIETPEPSRQAMLNKEAEFERVKDILLSAKAAGWKKAKLYFMVGLPIGIGVDEETNSILEFLSDIISKTKMEFNVNVGTFVPKPHTPFERCGQLGAQEASKALSRMKSLAPRGARISYHDPFVSTLEGLICRGDETMAAIIEKGYESGQRLEAWDEYRNNAEWGRVLEGLNPDLETATMNPKSESRELPWDDINFGISPKYFQKEVERSIMRERTSACQKKCTSPCGSCNEVYGDVSDSIQFDTFSTRIAEINATPKPASSGLFRGILKFIKANRSMYISHLNLMDVFSKALLRGNIPVVFSNGFNPQPRIEIAQPLPLGIASRAEYAGIYLTDDVDAGSLQASINPYLPSGITISDAILVKQDDGQKAPSLSSLPPGSRVLIKESGITEDQFVHKSIIRKSVLPEGIELDIRVGSTKDEQAFSFLKEIYGDRPSSWPWTERVEAMVFDEKTASLISYFNAINSLYGK